MDIVKKLYHKSGWDMVFNSSDEGGRARSDLLKGGFFLGVHAALTDGVFYTGFLMCYGINIVNISILAGIPYIASLFSLFTPKLLAKIQKRRGFLVTCRFFCYLIKILGITVLPQLVHSETGRIWGLILITFSYSALTYLAAPALSAWHMHYITPEVRAPYYAAITIINSFSSLLIPLLISSWIDALDAQAQNNAFIILRCVAFAVSLLDIYYYHRPREPVYVETSDHHSLLDVISIPFSNTRFLLTILINWLYSTALSIGTSAQNAWLLGTVETGYNYISIMNFLYIPFAVLTQGMWSKVIQRKGTFWLMAVSLLLWEPACFMMAFVNHDNYLWLMSAARLIQHFVGIGLTLATNNLLYINLPEEDKTCYISAHTFFGNIANILGVMIGTWVVAAIGEGSFGIGKLRFGAVPMTQLLEGFALLLVVAYIVCIRKKVDTGRKV